MKNILFLLLSCLCLHRAAVAQSFEGYIKYAYTVDLSPEQKAQMEKAQAQMNSPEMKAQMEAMKAKMNDPEFKKMMESNPQLKAQIDAMMTLSQSGTADQLLPKESVVHVKNGNTLYQIKGGVSAFTGDILYLKAKDQSYHLYRDRKTYRPVKKEEEEKQKTSTATVTKTTETQTILGHLCTKYLVKDGELTLSVWATTDLKDLYEDLKKVSLSKDKSFYMEQINGIPLKVEGNTQGTQFTMQVVEIKKQTENAADFMIPAGYVEEK